MARESCKCTGAGPLKWSAHLACYVCQVCEFQRPLPDTLTASFRKDDTGKARYDLIPARVIDEVAVVFAHGATKYGDDNWRKCDDPARYFAAAQRHLWAWRRGEPLDNDSGLSHLAHALASVFMLAGLDDTKR